MKGRHRMLGDTTMNGTIARLRSASAWILHPTRLIDRLLEQLEKLSVVLVLPTPGGRLSSSELPIAVRVERFGPHSRARRREGAISPDAW